MSPFDWDLSSAAQPHIPGEEVLAGRHNLGGTFVGSPFIGGKTL